MSTEKLAERLLLKVAEENETLSAKLAAAEQRAAEAERDAERYRWLRHIDHAQLQVFAHYAGPALDAAIDAAMESGK